MTKIFISFLLLATSVSVFGQSTSSYIKVDSSVALKAKQQAEEMLFAMFNKDHKTLIKYLYPELVKNYNRDQMIRDIDNATQALAGDSSSFETLYLSYPFSFVIAGTQLQCVISDTMIFKRPHDKLKINNILIGISNDNGNSWFYIDTNGEDLIFLKLLLPLLSDKLLLPEKAPDQIIDN